jgi:tetratricopeptide (TPR) repeat protein
VKSTFTVEFDKVIRNTKVLIEETEKDLNVVSTAQNDFDKLMAAGRIYERSFSLSTAEFFYKEAHLMNRNEEETSIRLAIVKLKSGQKDEAMSLINKLVDKYPKATFRSLSGFKCSVMSLYGDALYLIGDKAKAKSVYKQAMEIEGTGSWATGRYTELLIEDNEISTALQFKDKIPQHEIFDGLDSFLNLMDKKNEIGLPGIETAVLYRTQTVMPV